MRTSFGPSDGQRMRVQSQLSVTVHWVARCDFTVCRTRFSSLNATQWASERRKVMKAERRKPKKRNNLWRGWNLAKSRIKDFKGQSNKKQKWTLKNSVFAIVRITLSCKIRIAQNRLSGERVQEPLQLTSCTTCKLQAHINQSSR